eukprot:jgi/Ulvmu1/12400/UM009_0047.1
MADQHEDIKPATPAAMLEALRSRDCNDVLFFPLYGHSSDTECMSSVLTINGMNILLDCGWTESCDANVIAPLAIVAPHIDLVLLSHADIAHIGALPYAVAKLGLKTDRIHCSLPVQHMGHLALYELLASRQDVSEFDAFTFDDIDAAFESIQGVRFGQQLNFSPPSAQQPAKRLSGGSSQDTKPPDQAPLDDTGSTMQATAHAAGHSLGGAVWHMSLMNQDFVYAVSFNLKGDSHLHGCSIHSVLHRPAMLITEADCIGRVDPPPQQAADLCAAVVAALRRPAGHVLIPVDTTARVLELLLILEHHWASKGLSYPIVFLAKTALSVVTKARAQLEFLSENVQKQFSRGRGANPFELPHVHATTAVEALNTLPNNAQLVVLAPLASLSAGLARDLLVNCGWAADPANTVLLPLGGGPPGSMAAQLADHAQLSTARGPQQLRVEVAWRVPLTEEELHERKAAEEAALRVKAEQEEQAAAAARQAAGPEVDANTDTDMADAAAGPAADEAEDALLAAPRGHSASVAQRVAGGGQTHAAAAPDTGGDGAIVPSAAAASGAFDGVLIDGFRVPEDAVAPMFPFAELPPPADDYGEEVDLMALFGVAAHDDEAAASEDDAAAADAAALQGAVDLPMMDVDSSKVVREVRTLAVHAEVRLFDFRSLISQSSFLSMLKAIAPRNVVVLRRPRDLEHPAGAGAAAAPPLQALLAGTLRGRFSHVHMPHACEVVKMASTAAYAATMTQELSQRVEEAPKSLRPPYRLGWLDSVVVSRDARSGALLLGEVPQDRRDGHTAAGVYLGNMFVTQVTRRLKQRTLPVEQEGECAVVGDADVLVRQEDKEGHNDLVIEGTVSRLFYQVRDEVYKEYRLIPSDT